MNISIIGNSGSGKSTLAIKLAALLSKNMNVIAVDTNYIAPQLQVWMPDKDIEKEKSLANLLSNDIQTDLFIKKMIVLNDNCGAVGYVKGDISINNIPKRSDTVQKLIKVAASVADCTVYDCQTNLTQDILSFEAVCNADVVIISITPDLRGVAWYQANMPMLESKIHGKVIRVFNQLRRYAPAEVVENHIGNIDYYLPYDENLYIQMIQGNISRVGFEVSDYNKLLRNIVNNILG